MTNHISQKYIFLCSKDCIFFNICVVFSNIIIDWKRILRSISYFFIIFNILRVFLYYINSLFVFKILFFYLFFLRLYLQFLFLFLFLLPLLVDKIFFAITKPVNNRRPKHAVIRPPILPHRSDHSCAHIQVNQRHAEKESISGWKRDNFFADPIWARQNNPGHVC